MQHIQHKKLELSVKKWSVVMWSELTWFMWGDFILKLKWSEVSYGEVLWDKSTMYTYLRVTLYWGYLIVLWLFHLVCILYCGCFNLFYNVLGVLVICVLVFTVFCTVCTVLFVLFRLCIFILVCFVCTSVRTTATEWQVNCS